MKVILSFLFLSIFALPSFAGFMVEPYLAYDFSTTGKVRGNSSDAEVTTSAVTVGGRAGYKLPMKLWFALDLTYSNGQEKWDYTSAVLSDSSNTFNRTLAFVDVGYDLPFFMRAWAGYAVYNQWQGKNTTSYTATGDAYKIGAGLTSLPLVSLNIEYTIYNYRDFDQNGQKANLTTNDQSSIAIGVSLPLSFESKKEDSKENAKKK